MLFTIFITVLLSNLVGYIAGIIFAIIIAVIIHDDSLTSDKIKNKTTKKYIKISLFSFHKIVYTREDKNNSVEYYIKHKAVFDIHIIS